MSIDNLSHGGIEHGPSPRELDLALEGFRSSLAQLVYGLRTMPSTPVGRVIINGSMTSILSAPSGLAFELSRKDGQSDLAEIDDEAPSVDRTHDYDADRSFFFDTDHPMTVDVLIATVNDDFSGVRLELVGAQPETGLEVSLSLDSLTELHEYNLTAVSEV